MPKAASSRLRFKNEEEARKLRRERKHAAKAQRRAEKAREFVNSTAERQETPSLSATAGTFFTTHDSSDDGGVPWHRARKPDSAEFVSLWDDVDEDEMVYDSRQAQWARTSAEQAEEDAVFESYDAWASRIAAEMRRKGGRQTDEGVEDRRQKFSKLKDSETKTAASFLQEEAARKQKSLQRDRLAYRTAWSALSNAKGTATLGVKDVPVPVESGQTVARESVFSFFFAGCDFSVEEKRKMLRDSLLLWHPDKFAKRKPLFRADVWDKVTLLVNNVSQALNAIYADL
ncbi:hypothetical protein HDU87_002395 [Geranomyces variabilis]|uniref:Uncharacterized protein n=1 Tax=Geranomyces variabilis TaxID=109894 RepID=A0AAD5TLB1_9FUNG|nr:hypothetical protein HDU87_002395 [Geranomyces variabilis]